MRSRCLIVLILCVLPSLSYAQYWRKTQTQKYQKQVEKLDSVETSGQELVLPATLSLVFHIVYPKRKEAPSRADIQWQVDQLNKHFSMAEFYEKQAKYGVSKFDALAVDTEIRFCLDKIFFSPSDSINFKDFQTIKNDKTKGAKAFKPQEYINIWVGKLADNSGFSQMPGGIWETDGIVIDIDLFGPQPPPYHEGKTLTHLMGNYLGLRDIWGDGYCMDDGIADTPIHNAPNNGHITNGQAHFSTCTDSGLEMYMNFMDNTEDSLLYMFTKGQKARMHEVLQTTRNSLLATKCKGNNKANGLTEFRNQAVIDNALENIDHPILTIFPNPGTDILNIQYQGKSEAPYELTVQNILGETIFSTILPQNQVQQIEVTSWMPGIYLIRVNDPYLTTQPFIKQ